MKINKITITSGELNIIQEALDEYAQSFLDFQKECPEDCNDEEIHSIVMRIRNVGYIFDTIFENSPLSVEVVQNVDR